AHQPGAVVFRGWAYEPNEVRANLDRSEERHPRIPVEYTAVSGNYADQLPGARALPSRLRTGIQARRVSSGATRPDSQAPANRSGPSVDRRRATFSWSRGCSAGGRGAPRFSRSTAAAP